MHASLLCLSVLVSSTSSWSPGLLLNVPTRPARRAFRLSPLLAVDVSLLPEPVSYEIRAGPPLGLILTEFESGVEGAGEEAGDVLTPLEVSDVSEGSAAARLGVRAGDVLVGLNGLSLLAPGIGFDVIMSAIKGEFEGEEGEVTAKFFRGSQFGGIEGFDSVVDAIVNKQEVDEGLVEEIENTEDVNVFAMGIEDPEAELPSAGELFSSLLKETAAAVKEGLKAEETPASSEGKKDGGGLFGMFGGGGEVIQMDENPNQFANPTGDRVKEAEEARRKERDGA
mmetsp:Transcript_11779/g.23438  ORF Transcript_11779/g.23438 Transcript_11779/m.23438 type:complete len:282 (+) Transcript_11779:57-902(+)